MKYIGKSLRKFALLAFVLNLFTCAVFGSVVVANLEYVVSEEKQDVADIMFDIRWDDSWRAPLPEPFDDLANWDAVWVFAKYRQFTGGEGARWRHVWLASDGHEAPATALIDTGKSNGKNFGVFIYRSNDGAGTFELEGVSLRLDAAASGIKPGSDVEISLHAVEMVYMPGGPFDAGAGGSAAMGGFVDGSWEEDEIVPYRVSGEGSLKIANESGGLWSSLTRRHGAIGQPGTLPGDFPKGYAPFYCMKRPLSWSQYADFLNKIDYDQAANRMVGIKRNPADLITGKYPDFTPGADPDLPCVWISWADGCAYAAWAGLRPMTELEFEKMSRAKEIEGIDSPSESPVLSVLYWGPTDPVAGFWERVVSVGTPEGRSFIGSLGQGILTDSGAAPNSDWPGYVGDGVAGCEGTGFRGGDWPYYAGGYRRAAARRYASFSNPDWDNSTIWRGVRPAQ